MPRKLVPSEESSPDDLPRRKLREIVAYREALADKTGRDVLKDPQLCKALLKDLCGEHKREIFVLVTALEEGIAANLLAAQENMPLQVLLAQLTERLVDNRALNENAARWAVESWALALEVIELERGLKHLSEGHWDEAIDEFEEIVRIAPSFIDAHIKLGEVYYLRGDLDESVSEFEAALRINPDCVEAHVGLGKVYGKRGRWEDATLEYETALEVDPNSADAHYRLGRTYQVQGVLEDAARELESVLRIDPDFSRAHFYLGNIYWQQGRKSEAIKEYRSVLQQDPKILTEEAKHCEQSNDLERAIAIYQLLVEAFPDNPEWASTFNVVRDYQKALTAIDSGNAKQARELLMRVVALRPDYKKAVRYLALMVEDIDINFVTLQLVEDVDMQALIRNVNAGLESMPLDRLGLSTRVHNLLIDEGVKTVSDLYRMFEEGEQALLDIRGFGDKSLAEVKDKMPELNKVSDIIEFRRLSLFSNYQDKVEAYLNELREGIPLEAAGLSGGPLHALQRAGYKTVADVYDEMLAGGRELLEISGFGRKSLAHLRESIPWQELPKISFPEGEE
jgi:tetratricopeptide (TPR) repeat protein